MADISIICADKEEITVRLLAARFDFLGWEARFATSAGGALALIRDKLPDALITEIQLEASSSYGLIKAIRSDADSAVRGLPIIVLSHMSQLDDRGRALRLGADDYILKPFDITVIEARIDDITGRRAARQADSGVGS